MKDFIYTLLLFFYALINPDLYDSTPPQIAANPDKFSVLVFSKTQKNAYRHKSIESGKTALQKIADSNDWTIFFTENGATFNDADLEKFDTVVFLSTAGNILSISQKSALKAFITGGGGFLGIHAASDTEHHWSWYKKALAGMYSRHFAPQPAVLKKHQDHPTITALPENWQVTDEWYLFSPDPGENAEVLVSHRSEKSHGPVIWHHQQQKGRVYYTALGHRPELFSNDVFLQHLRDAIAWTGRE